MQDRILAAGLQPTTSAQFVGLLAARRVCTDTSGDERMRKTSTWLLEQGTQTPSPAPDLIPAETRTENSHWDWYSKRGHFKAAPAEFSRGIHSLAESFAGLARLFRLVPRSLLWFSPLLLLSPGPTARLCISSSD